ncbi:MAG: phospho-N-acetylmuramoyl-pentapeptide-transferase [Chlamydiae bacterium]|nr:phospho-N-acetylmuramoyl-pentapeptide-transferase [Chlamydiota bacterium]
MLLLFLKFLSNSYNIKIPAVFSYSSTRMLLATMTTLIFTILFGPFFIRKLYQFKTGQTIRVEDCPLLVELHQKKRDTPTMGGSLILFSMILSLVLWMDFSSSFTLILLVVTVWLGLIGGVDDYLKMKHKNSKGLNAKKKFGLQILLSTILSLYLFSPFIADKISGKNLFHPPIAKEFHTVDKENKRTYPNKISNEISKDFEADSLNFSEARIGETTAKEKFRESDQKNRNIEGNVIGKGSKSGKGFTLLSTQQYMCRYYFPFFKDPWFILKGSCILLGGLIIAFVLTGSSNAVNLTDGLDGLASGTLVLTSAVLSVFAFLSNNVEIARYLNILYIEGSGEIGIYLCSLIGACLGFLWYNGYPAQIFMGDTGSLSLGGIIGISAILLRREAILAIAGGIFVAEALSVILQVASYRLRNKKRIFLCAPLHHHFEFKGWTETKVVLRFWIIGLILAIFALLSIKFQ